MSNGFEGPITIARFEPEMRSEIGALIVGIQQQEFGLPITLADQPDLLDVPAFYQVGTGEFWVARIGDQTVGTLALKDIGNGEMALRKMFVVPEARGKFGAAKALLDSAIAHAESAGVHRIYLGTADRLHAAHRFYEKNGFTRIDASELPSSFPRMAVDTIFYRR